MASQQDFFGESDSSIYQKGASKLVSSMNYKYREIILFHWSEKKDPFRVHSKDEFKEIKPNWISNQLTDKARSKQIRIDNTSVSLFAKIEEETDSNHVNNVLDNLNLQFKLLNQSNKNVTLAYKSVINTNPYTVLAEFTYDNDPVPRNMGSKKYDVNESPSPSISQDIAPFESHFESFPDHRDFMNKLGASIENAMLQKKCSKCHEQCTNQY